MLKSIIAFVLFALAPFIIIWVGYIMTAGAFDPQMVFKNQSFWGISTIYWVLLLCFAGLFFDED